MKTTTRIIHILPAYAPGEKFDLESIATSGGGARYAIELAKAVANIADTTLLTFGQVDDNFLIGNLKVVVQGYISRVGANNGKSGFNYLRVLKLLKQFDVIHVHHYYADTTLVAAVAARVYRRRLFVTDLGWRGATVSRFFPAKYFCSKILGLTEYERGRFNVPQDKFAPIYGGVDLHKYPMSQKKTKRVMFVGRLVPHKGVDYLIRALDAETECIIAGHRSDRRYYELLEQLAKGKRVQFLFSASDDEIRDYLQTSTVIVLPSVDRDVYGKKHNTPELFGLVIAEAFACGTPAIVSDSSALPFVVDDGETGFIVPQNDANAIRIKLTLLLSNPDEVARMGRRARKKAEDKYNWDAVAATCLDNYEAEPT
jgi:glycosyltransferase involved in cell wall biosynthesis